MRAWLAVALLAAATGVPSGLAVQAPPFDLVRQWRAAVDAHLPGERDDVADAVSLWPPDALEAVVSDLVRLRGLLDRAGRERRSADATIDAGRGSIAVAEIGRLLGLSPAELDAFLRGSGAETRAIADAAVDRVLARGALLHLDVALLVPPGIRLVREDDDPNARSTISVLDGRAQGIERAGEDHASVHRAQGERLVTRLSLTPRNDALVRRWYRAMAAHLLVREQYGSAAPLLERALDVLRDDATLLFYRGVLHELFASPRIQSVTRSLELPEGYQSEVGPAREELGLAQLFLTESLAMDPTRLDARVRYGRVLGLLGRPADARAELAAVLPDIEDRPLRYYALLFLGDQHRALGDRDAARAAYADAGRLFPRAQTPRLALAYLERHHGDRADAVEALGRAISRPVRQDRRDDPWWVYHESYVADAGDQIVSLRSVLASGGGS